MRTLLILLALVFAATGMIGCNATASRSVGMNCMYMCDDVQRVVGLDKASPLHPRDNVDDTMYEPYRGY